MPTVTLTAPPEPFSCQLCSRPEWREKAGPSCQECPAFQGFHYFPKTTGPEVADVIVVGDAPAPPPKLTLIGGRSVREPVNAHDTFEDTAGKVVKAAVDAIGSRREFKSLQYAYAYAVKCAVENPNKKTIVSCSGYLRTFIHRVAARRRDAGIMTPIVILACGVDSLTALGIQARSEDAELNRVHENVNVAGVIVNVVFTRSLKSLASQDGKFNTLLADVERAASLATNRFVAAVPREQMEKDFIYPRTLDEVRELIDHVIAYREDNVPPLQWKISIDTETNTLHPNWDGTKLLLVSFAWAPGKAAAVPLWHPETPYDPTPAFEEVKRLLASRKPLIWHNAKYDYKVFWKMGWPLGDVGNTYWDSMLAEHTLEEDKKRYYSLKMLTKQFIPELSGYEDRLQDMLEAENDTVDVTQPAEEAEEAERQFSPAIAKALEVAVKAKLIKNENFQAKTLEKALTNEKYEALREDLQLLINAKKSGAFRQTASTPKSKKTETGGFESIPLKELSFYACVDVDATRKLTIIQNRRMAEEQERVNKMRKTISAYQTYSRDPRDKAFTVETLCPHPQPLKELVTRHYVPRQIELAKIEYQGMRVNLDYLRWGMSSLSTTIEHTRNQIFQIAGGEEFKLGSAKRLAQLLFGEGYQHPEPAQAQDLAERYPDLVTYRHGRISYKAQAYTAKGAIQTSDSVMKSLVAKYKCPLANLILAHKKADKAKNTFFANIEALATYFGDGKLHSGYGLANTSTGRLSSSVKVGDARFNAQNIPKGLIGAMRDLFGALVLNDKGKPVFEGVNCKKLFIPDDDSYCFGNADAKGAEVSVYAAYSRDAALIAALREGLDAHCFFGSECLNPSLVAAGLTGEDRRLALTKAGIDDDHAWTYDDFLKGKDGLLEDKAYGKRLKMLRDNIKRLVFGMLYGAGIKKIAEIAGIPHEFAKQIQDLLFTKFPTIRTFMDRTKWELQTFGLVEAFNGRRRRFLIGKGAPSDLRAQAERRAINFKVQGTNSDIVLSVLCWLAPVIENDLKGRLLLTVHDSIGFQVPKKYAHQVREIFTEYGTRRVAEVYPWMPVPYRWDVELGPSYGEVIDAEKYVNKLPAPLPAPELDGYTEEEKDEDLRDMDSFHSPERTRDPNQK